MAKIDWSTVEIEGEEREGLRAVCVAGKWGVIDAKDNVIVKPQYLFVGPFSEGLAWFEKDFDNDYGFIDNTGKEVIAPTFAFASNFHEGRALIIEEGKFGFIDPTGDKVIPATFDAATRFEDGKAEVEKDFETFSIGRDGKRIAEGDRQ